MILKRLRIETSEVHALLEARLPLVNPDLSREEYRGIVSGFYGFCLFGKTSRSIFRSGERWGGWRRIWRRSVLARRR
jgi:hypothetical protein